jgi:methylthioribulose-1-phosphate dehydratase
MLGGLAGEIPDAAAEAIIAAGRRMDARGWVPATAGNHSVRLGEGRIAITRSGGHKGLLTKEALMVVDAVGAPLTPDAKPSAETLLHCQIYREDSSAGAVLHGHSVAATVLSLEERSPSLSFTGYEVQKIFAGQTSHEAALGLPLFPNDQDIARLAAHVQDFLRAGLPMGYVIRGHGVYVWGPDMAMALARLEGLEFLLECELERRKLRRVRE